MESDTMFNVGQQFFHPDMELTYQITEIRQTNKGNLYTLLAEDCMQARYRYKSYYEQKLIEKCELLEQENG